MTMLSLKLEDDDIEIALPDDIRSMSTYVFLEQERWFEKEIAFLRSFIEPGMTAVDIGANVGAYSLMLARRVGSTGRVLAFEPATGTREFLERSASVNGFGQLDIVPFAVAESNREDFLVFGESSELNQIGADGAGEAIQVTTLDSAAADRGVRSADFVKIDAEGQERNVLKGGRNFLGDTSPLVMFEISHGGFTNNELLQDFADRGYRAYRHAPGLNALLPLNLAEVLDPYELNVFGAKADRAAALIGSNLLIDNLPEGTDVPSADGLAMVNALPFATAASEWRNWSLDREYADVLAYFAVGRSSDIGLSDRLGALRHARELALSLCAHSPTPSRLVTLARILNDLGERENAVSRLRMFVDLLNRPPPKRIEPFLPPLAFQENVIPRGNLAASLVTFATEALAHLHVHSTCLLSGGDPILGFASEQLDASLASLRRRYLLWSKLGVRESIPSRLLDVAPGHVNARLWRDGTVSGLVARALRQSR